MAPSVMIENDSDFSPNSTKTSSKPRTLLLAPPSISSHEENLRNVLASYDRAITDLQMLDRLSAGLVILPDSIYDLIVILSDADGKRSESTQLLGREVFSKIVQALKAGGRLEAQDGTLGQDPAGTELREAILAGLIFENNTIRKPDYGGSEAVPLRFRRKDKTLAVSCAGPAVFPTTVHLHGKRKSTGMAGSKVQGVGFVDFSDDLGEDDDDELIDEDTLLTEEEMKRPADIPPECAPRIGKRRRACKDCTCGLAEKIAAEDAAKRANADDQLRSLKLGVDDLAEVDFTVQGKVGSCGNCSLGDAFRCDGCVSLSLIPHHYSSRESQEFKSFFFFSFLYIYFLEILLRKNIFTSS